jgi:dTDP-4-amino-4,6-dideoxygalactose transaminase
MYQIGGEIQISNFYFNASNSLFDKNVYYLSHGRAAINLILKSIIIRGSFLLPSYLCESVLQPFISNNVKIDFYEVDDNLHINLEDLALKIKKGNIQGVYIINYFGFLYNDETNQFLQEIKKEVLIIEDFSHGSLLETNGHNLIGHFIFSSLRKYLSLPDGCILINKSHLKLNQELISGSFHNFFELKFTGKILKSIYNKSMPKKVLEQAYLKLFQHGEEILNTNSEIFSISNYSMEVLKTIDFKLNLSTRQQNFKKLQILFQDIDNDIELFNFTIEKDISPFIFPIKVRNEIRNKLRRKLGRENLYCSILWPKSTALNIYQFPRTYKLCNSILCLPIDQRYNTENMIDLFTRFMKVYEELC